MSFVESGGLSGCRAKKVEALKVERLRFMLTDLGSSGRGSTKDHYKMWMYGPWVDILCYWPITASSMEEPTTSQSSFGLEAA